MKTNYIITAILVLFVSLFPKAQTKSIEIGTDPEIIERYAFIIGNDHYKDESISTLASCRLDAERFYNFVTSNEGYNIEKDNTRVLLDASKDQIITEFNLFLKTIKEPKNSSIYFYYSGHGIQGALLPTDFILSKPETMLSYNWIKKALIKTEILSPLLIIDACYSGSLISEKATKAINYNALASIKGETLPSNFTVFTATSAYRVTPAGRHSSAYTRNFLKAIGSEISDLNNNGIITTGELSIAITQLMKSSNEPQFSGKENFSMARLDGNKGYRKKIAKLERSARTSDIIAWRYRVETATDSQLASEVKQLTQSNLIEDKSKLGFMYRKGFGVEKNANTAIQFFILGALEENPFAIYNLGFMYYHGFGVNVDIVKAFELYKKAAGLNDAFAQYNLGCLYLAKKDHPDFYNEEKGISYYRRAATLGFSQASYKLGKLYLTKSEAENSQQNIDLYRSLAIKYFEKAASQNHTNAQFKLAGLYKEGITTSKNTKRANFWLKQACSNNHLIACKMLMRIAVN